MLCRIVQKRLFWSKNLGGRFDFCDCYVIQHVWENGIHAYQSENKSGIEPKSLFFPIFWVCVNVQAWALKYCLLLHHFLKSTFLYTFFLFSALFSISSDFWQIFFQLFRAFPVLFAIFRPFFGKNFVRRYSWLTSEKNCDAKNKGKVENFAKMNSLKKLTILSEYIFCSLHF